MSLLLGDGESVALKSGYQQGLHSFHFLLGFEEETEVISIMHKSRSAFELTFNLLFKPQIQNIMKINICKERRY